MELVRTTEIEGDPGFGTLYYFRQMHWRPEYRDISDPENLLIDIHTAEIQFTILRELERLRPRHIFNEPIMAETVRDWPLILTMRQFRRAAALFEESPERFSDLSLESALHLAELGAAYVYVIRHPEVELHVTTTQALIDADNVLIPRLEAEGLLYNADGSLSEIGLSAFAGREAFVTDQISEFFSAHLGETAALEYGSLHEFSDDFNGRENHPLLLSYDWHRP